VTQGFDYDLAIIGAGVGGHGAAIHAVSCGLKVAIIEAGDMGGTCVNRGCIPSKALLAASGRVRDLRNAHHLKTLGIQLGSVDFDRGAIANHANTIVSKLRGDLTNSLKRLSVILSKVGAKSPVLKKLRSKPIKARKLLLPRILFSLPVRFPLSPPG